MHFTLRGRGGRAGFELVGRGYGGVFVGLMVWWVGRATSSVVLVEFDMLQAQGSGVGGMAGFLGVLVYRAYRYKVHERGANSGQPLLRNQSPNTNSQ